MAVRLLSNPRYTYFQGLKIVARDETKSWKPPVTVEVRLRSGTLDTIPAATPFFTFESSAGSATVSAVAADHIRSAHFEGSEGSTSCYLAPDRLMEVLAEYLPDDLGAKNERAEFEFDTGKPAGVEGVASVQELAEAGVLRHTDVATLIANRSLVALLNKDGSLQAKKSFIADFTGSAPTCQIQFRLVRETVLVPVVVSPKRVTNKLFVVFGPGDTGLTLYTAMPGRQMPRHPNPAQFRPEEGGVEGDAFRQASDAWLNTVMLVPAQ